MLATLNQIDLVAQKLHNYISNKQNIVVLLQGDLASGKTTLVNHYLKLIGIKQNALSPTYSIQSIYDNKIFHYDIYNKTLDQFISLGLLEEFEKDGVHFVEWADEQLKQLLQQYGFDILTIKIIKHNNKREYSFET
jgi:tRNA threonylcarbamoyladenosine biosynthesis protein TsaE